MIDRAIARLRTKEGRAPMPGWTLHDLRRTAKTLMARAGVRPDISERVLAHAIAGVEATYDRYEYLAEQADALDRLAALVARITGAPSAYPAPAVKPVGWCAGKAGTGRTG